MIVDSYATNFLVYVNLATSWVIGGCFADRFHQAADISIGIEDPDRAVAGKGIAVFRHRGHVIRPDRALETDVIVGFHRFVHIDLAFVMKTFFKFELAAPDIPEMDKVNDFTGTQVADRGGDIDAHEGKVALAHGDAVVRTGIQVQHAFKIIDSRHDA